MTISRRIALVNDKNIITDISLYKLEEVTDFMVDITDFPDAGIGWQKVKNNWIPPKPYDNWIFDKELNNWIPPITKPIEDPKGQWFWHQDENAWVDIIAIPVKE